MVYSNKMAMWHRIEHVECSPTGELSGELQIQAESLWFSGHFPDQPILPGIAQLALVCDTIGQGLGGHAVISDFSRVKFKKMITPGEQLKIVASPKSGPDETYAFRILAGDEIACTGTLTLKND